MVAGFVKVLDDKLAMANVLIETVIVICPVKSEDDASEGTQQAAELARDGVLHLALDEQSAFEGAGDSTVRGDDRERGAELPVGDEGCGVCGATSSCDDDSDAGGFGGAQSSQVALADSARRGVKQSSIHVDCHKANRWVHAVSLQGSREEGFRDRGTEENLAE